MRPCGDRRALRGPRGRRRLFKGLKQGIARRRVYCVSPDIERNLGEQPIARILSSLGLKPNDLVSVSGEQLTHKMVSKACSGRRLTPNVRNKVLNAVNRASGRQFTLEELFNY